MINVWIKSIDGFLIEMILGEESDKGFSGIIIVDDTEYFVFENKVLNHDDFGYINEQQDLFFDKINEIKKSWISYPKDKEKKCVQLFLYEYYLSDFNSESNPFSFNVSDLIKVFSKDDLKFAMTSSEFVSAILRLKRFKARLKEYGDENLIAEFQSYLP